MTRKTLHYIKRYAVSVFAVLLGAAAILTPCAEDLKLLRETDRNTEELLLTPKNNTENAVVNINFANAHELTHIDGIGLTAAQAVVEYREKHGGFRSVDELLNVDGIGEKTLSEIRGFITV